MAQNTTVDERGQASLAGVEASVVASELGVEPERGLSADEVRSRLQSHGPNRLAGGKKESGLQAFLRQYQDFMQIVLLAAAVINLLATQDVGTSVVLAGHSARRAAWSPALLLSRPKANHPRRTEPARRPRRRHRN